jgi:hypothetical protein
VAGATWRASERARPASFPTLRRCAARNAAGTALFAWCVAPCLLSGGCARLWMGASEVSAPYGCACGCALHPLTRVHAALARCTSAARRGASEAWLHGALRRVQSTQPCSVSLQRGARASRRSRAALGVLGASLAGQGAAATSCASDARGRGAPGGEWQRGGFSSEADSRARCRRLFRLSTDARGVCR